MKNYKKPVDRIDTLMKNIIKQSPSYSGGEGCLTKLIV